MLGLRAVQSMRQECEKIAVSAGWVQKAVQQAEVPKHRLVQFADKMTAASKDSFKRALPTIRRTGEGSVADKHNLLMRDVADSTARSRWRASPGHSSTPAVKQGSELTESARSDIAPKNFALSAKQSDTGKPAYPIEDKAHAANALARVKQHGDVGEKAEVYKDVARKYPELASHSSVPAVKEKAKEAGEALSKFISGAKGELGPALGATIGAGAGKVLGIDPLAGAAAGYGLGALPEIIHGARRRGKVNIGPPVGP